MERPWATGALSVADDCSRYDSGTACITTQDNLLPVPLHNSKGLFGPHILAVLIPLYHSVLSRRSSLKSDCLIQVASEGRWIIRSLPNRTSSRASLG
jgi:hypothetical protein